MSTQPEDKKIVGSAFRARVALACAGLFFVVLCGNTCRLFINTEGILNPAPKNPGGWIVTQGGIKVREATEFDMQIKVLKDESLPALAILVLMLIGIAVGLYFLGLAIFDKPLPTEQQKEDSKSSPFGQE